MKKRKIILLFIIGTCLCTLFLNFLFNDEGNSIHLFLEHTEALAEEETIKPSLQCIESRCICIGIDKHGHINAHHGLMEAPNQ